MSNSFAFIVMLTAARDIMSSGTNKVPTDRDLTNSTSSVDSTAFCEKTINRNECRVEPLGVVLLANIIPAFFIKSIVPFFMHRLPFSLIHITVCACQATSYILVSFTSSVQMSLLGVVFAAIGCGLGDICYLALASHYHRDTISFWSSGTGASGILASLTYAVLTEPHLANFSPHATLLIMLVVPLQFFLTYFLLLSPAQTVYHPKIAQPRTWLIPEEAQFHSAVESEISYTQVGEPLMDKKLLNEKMTAGKRMRVVWTLLRYIAPLTFVYFCDFVVNQGLTAFMVFDCNHGLDLSPVSQYRWYQVTYCVGSFFARSSTNFFHLPYVFLIVFPFLEALNAVFFFFNSLYFFIPHIWLVFALIFAQGLIGGLAYANTYYRIHKEVDPSIREFSLACTTMSDAIGIMAAGLSTLPIHSAICGFYTGAR
ncbi:Battenin [Aphelenchoides bicaudatus]|nr:Battenin [Aphelenchoides bicaudatus]